MKAVFRLVLIFCTVWESTQLRCTLIEKPDLYHCGHRIDGDELIYERLGTVDFYENHLNFFYPSREAIVSFYKITYIEIKDYGNEYYVDTDGGLNNVWTKIRIEKANGNLGKKDVKVRIYGKYLGPCEIHS